MTCSHTVRARAERSFRAFVLPGLLCSLCTAAPASAAPASAESFAPVKLRGYGTLAGELTAIPGNPASSELKITCDGEGKARIVLAKFLSDLELLPGVSPLPLATRRGAVAARAVEGQGAVAAARAGRQVFIFTAADGAGLSDLFASRLPADVKVDATDAEVAVPMYLDRWDKHGFRFYYGPFVKPQLADHRDDAAYGPRQDFTFAEKNGHSGLVLWNVPAGADTSEGIMDLNSREWVYRQAQRQTLPLGINIGIEDRNVSLGNRYPGAMVPFAEQYLGGWYGALNMGGKTVGWGSDEVQEVALGQIQQLVKYLSPRYDNIVNWLEPHEEMHHGNCDLLDDHGPAARESFLRFLQSHYGTPEAVARRWGTPDAFKTWDGVPFPEVASFFGWGKDAFDLTGEWKINYGADYGPASAKPDLDDSAWPVIQAPGHAVVRALPRKPAVFRRHFRIDPAWRAAHPKVWLYVWDLNPTFPRADTPTSRTDVLVYMNGRALPDDPPHRMETHWSAVDVTAALADDENLLTVCLPQAILDYRVYLAGRGPGVYPDLGPGPNAQWADFADWCVWSRGRAVRRGAQMIRQIDPDRPITLMSPGDYESPIKAVAEDYGGVFHDTGGMAGFWTDEPCLMMQSSGLPNDCEPGGGAVDLPDFKRFMGRWSTEATQGIDYFQHIGDVLWKPQVKEYFEQTQNLWHLIGKYHVPQPEVAILESDRNRRLFGFPWNLYDHQSSSPDLVLANGFYAWGLQSKLLPVCPRSTILEEDFGRGNVDPYRVVIDSNTTIIEPEVVGQIEKWVRGGGTFVTYKQTGRHTSVLRDAWPISDLTGYEVSGMDAVARDGGGLTRRKLHLAEGLAEGRQVFRAGGPGWDSVQTSSGLSLKKQDPACEDLLVWEDGSVAAGLRPLGKGVVIDLGTSAADPLLFQILEWAHVKRVPGQVAGNDVITRQFVSNNGLYDVWVLWNQKDKPLAVDLKFRDGYKPAACRDVNSGRAVAVKNEGDDASLPDLKLGPYETRAFLVPRRALAAAPADWFALQRSWWKGTADPGPAIPPYKPRLAMDLTDDCAFKTLPDPPPNGNPPEDPSPADPALDDSAWPRMPVGVFDLPDHQDAHHAIFRKHFTVPAEWDHGRVLLFTHGDDIDASRKFIDGKPLRAANVNDDLGGLLKPGTSHLLAVEIWGHHFPVGTRTPVWISYHPDPLLSRAIDGPWTFAPDLMRFAAPASLGKPLPGEGAVRCVVRINPGEAGHNIVLHARTSGADLKALIFNGHWTSGNGNIYRNLDVNVTPWVHFGEDNEVMFVTGKTTLQEATIEAYDPRQYP